MSSPVSYHTKPDFYPSRKLSVLVPDDDLTADRGEPDQKLSSSLQQSWRKAQAQFSKETGIDLGDYKTTKDGVLGTLKQQYGSDSKEAKKRDELMSTVGLILNGIELIGAITAQAAALVFGPADICFNALTILFSIPRAIQKNAEDLQALFNEIAAYLNTFKIYDRMDRRGMLDIALVTSNSDILITLVDLCLLAWKVMNHRFKTVFGNVFLKNDAIADALANFKGLIEKQNQLTTTMTLEAVLQNETKLRQLRQSTNRIEDLGKDTNRIVRDLAADNAESKNMWIDRDRIAKIDKALELSDTTVTTSLNQLNSVQSSLREETIAILNQNESYQDWYTVSAKVRLLYICGTTGSGKTCLLSALAWHIQNEKRLLQSQQPLDIKSKSQASKDDRSIYLTYFSFATSGKGSDSSKFNTPLHFALKIIAAQLARQSNRYAKFLKEKLDNPSATPLTQLTIRELWNTLKLDDFEDPVHSVLYIFLEDVDQLRDSLPELESLLKSHRSSGQKSEKLKLKVILTGKPKILQRQFDGTIISINITDINQPLITKIIDRELQNLVIFQDDDEDSKDRRFQVLDVIPSSSNGSFAVAIQKIALLREAIEEDADFETVMDKLESSTLYTLTDEGHKVLQRLSRDLSEQHREQLKEILIWCVYARQFPSLPELEAALHLQREKKSLEPLKRKIERRFEDALEISDIWVLPRAPVEEAIRSVTTDLSDPAAGFDDPKILTNASVGKADETVGKKLQLSKTLTFTHATAEYTIVSRLLRALTDEGVQRQAAPLITYASYYLPSHITTYKTESEACQSTEVINKAQLRTVGKGLINFLCDPESIASAWDISPFDPDDWLDDSNVRAIQQILEDPVVYQQLDPIERRWVKKYTNQSQGFMPFFTSLINTVAEKWIADQSYRENAAECFAFIDEYLDLIAREESNNFGYTSFSLVTPKTLEPYATEVGAVEKVNNGGQDENNNTEPETGTAVDEEQHIIPDVHMAESNVSFMEVEQGQSQSSNLDHPNASTLNPQIGIKSDAGETYQDFSLYKQGVWFKTTIPPEKPEADSRKKRGPLLGNFTHSSDSIKLTKVSHLSALCSAKDGSIRESSLDLNTCLGIHSGKLQWEWMGNAFEHVRISRLSTNGKVIQVVLKEGEKGENLQTIRLDEQISNKDGILTFLNEFPAADGSKDIEDTDDEDNYDVDFLPTYLERVKRAEEWALTILNKEMDWFALLRVGDTLVKEDPDTAIDYFKKCNPPPGDFSRGFLLGMAYATKGEYQETVKSFENVLHIMKENEPMLLKIEDTEAKPELDYQHFASIVDLFTCLTLTADYYTRLQMEKKAIELMEEALTLRPWACAGRWKLIYLLCRTDQVDRALIIFREWDRDETASLLHSPSTFLEKLTRDSSLDAEFLPIVHASRGTGLYDEIRGALEKAIAGENPSMRDADAGDLLYAHGLTAAADRGAENLEIAKKSWAEAFKIGRDSDTEAVRWSAKLLCMCHFDAAKKDFQSLQSPTSEDANIVVDRFADLVQQYESPSLGSMKVAQRPSGFIAGLGRITGQLHKSKAVLKPDLTEAINILSDDDINNDAEGITILMEAFAMYGDWEGVFTALSLLDRKRLRPIVEAKAKSQTAMNSPHIDQDQDPKMRQELGSDLQPAISKETAADEVDTRTNFYCDSCRKRFSTWETGPDAATDLWFCKYCPDMGFCTKCKDLLLQGDMPRFLCNPDHEFVLIQHPEYSPEEIRGDNVRVGWHWETVEVTDGTGEQHQGGQTVSTKRARVGGKIVKLAEWLNLLKEEWEITTMKIEGKVQQ